jgi:uncharacterized protein YbjT (DUF2867 family)
MSSITKVGVVGATGRVGGHTVDALREHGHEVVAMSRSNGVDVITGQGLDEALTGVDVVVDAATGPSPEEAAATEFFTTAARNLQQAGERAGVRRIVVVSIIGTDLFNGGYGAAKMAHERETLEGPIPALVLRASQFHEFVGQLLDWGRQGDVARVPAMRTQPIAARAVGEELARLATLTTQEMHSQSPITEIAGPREERLVELAQLLVARSGDPVRVEEWSDPSDPTTELYESGALLPGTGALLAGPTFEEWLEAAVGAPAR